MEFYEISEINGILDTKDINGILSIVKYHFASHMDSMRLMEFLILKISMEFFLL